MDTSNRTLVAGWPSDEEVKALASKVPTPFYLFSEESLRARYREVAEAFGNGREGSDCRILYSVKNNPLPAIVEALAEEGAWFECSEVPEVELLARVGVPTSRVVYTALWKSESAVGACIDHGVGLFTVDSVQDVQTIESVAKTKRATVRILLRVNTGVFARRTVFHAAGAASKAGALLDTSATVPGAEDVYSVLDALRAAPSLTLTGVHGHVGSQVVRLSDFVAHASRLAEFSRRATAVYGAPLPLLDVGGGLPVPYDGRPVPTVASIGRRIREQLRSEPFSGTVLVEPGRYLTADSGVLVAHLAKTRVRADGKHLAFVDASAYNVLLDSLVARWRYPIRVVGANSREVPPSVIVGSTNDTLDVFGEIGTYSGNGVGRALQIGDLIVIERVGAYSVCFNMNYAFHGRPAILFERRNGSLETIRAGESLDEVLGRFGA